MGFGKWDLLPVEERNGYILRFVYTWQMWTNESVGNIRIPVKNHRLRIAYVINHLVHIHQKEKAALEIAAKNANYMAFKTQFALWIIYACNDRSVNFYTL